jgi:hypothetical protein
MDFFAMHKDFAAKHPNAGVGCGHYMKAMQQLNISFTKFGEEECELCIMYQEQ